MKATEKQIAFIREIMAETGFFFDIENGTKDEASQYISEHIAEFKEISEYRNMNLWAIGHGYE